MNKESTFIATGDSFMTRRLPCGGYHGFNELRSIIAQYDARFTNLEITIHNQEGYPAAFSGGTWAMADPMILDDLKEFGFNLYNTANNHSCDYSHGGLLATIKNLRQRNMLFAGTGSNLAEASAATYLETKNARIALIAASSSFHEASIAGNQRFDMHGRPGLNPLRFKTTYIVEEKYFNVLSEVAELTKMNAKKMRNIKNGYEPPIPEGILHFGGLSFAGGDVNVTSTETLQKDMDRILASVQEASCQADYVLVSIHSHESIGEDTTVPAEFIRVFCRACIDNGAIAVLGHGPHELRGIELYKGGVIFYSLGNFIFQNETVALQPADAYEKHGMSNTTLVGEYMKNRSCNGTRGYAVQPSIWFSVMAGFKAVDGKLTQIQLYPVILYKTPIGLKGLPILAHDNQVLNYLADLSAPFGTKLLIKDRVAHIDL